MCENVKFSRVCIQNCAKSDEKSNKTFFANTGVDNDKIAKNCKPRMEPLKNLKLENSKFAPSFAVSFSGESLKAQSTLPK